MMKQDIDRILFSEEQLQARIAELGRQLTEDYRDKDPIFVGVLKGCFVFMADLLRSTDIYCTMDFMAVSSYGDGVTSTGAVKINKDLSRDIAGRHFIIVDSTMPAGNCDILSVMTLSPWATGTEQWRNWSGWQSAATPTPSTSWGSSIGTALC